MTILAPGPGSVLDAYVAEHVMGYSCRKNSNGDQCWFFGNDEVCKVGEFRPSTDLNSANQVIRYMEDGLGYKHVPSNDGLGSCVAKFTKDGSGTPYQSTSDEHAICIAAIQAIEIYGTKISSKS